MERTTSEGGLLGGLAVAVASVVLAGMGWVAFVVPLELLVGSGTAVPAASVLTGLVAVTGVASGRSGGPFTLRTAGYLVAMGVVTLAFLSAVFLLSAALLVFAPAELATTGTGLVTFVLASLCVCAFLAGLSDMDDRTNWELNLRMTAATVLLALCAVCLFGGVWVLAFVLSLFVLPPVEGFYAAAACSLGAMTVVGYAEYRQILTVEERADATPVTESEYPELYARTRRIAAQLDVPVPTIAVADRPTPEAMVVGFRPSNTHFVCSTGLVRALDDDELDAVVAHELAHVANRDAMVMTVVSAPVVVADGLLSWYDVEGVTDRTGFGDDEVGDTGLTEAELYGEDGEWAIAAPTDEEDDDGTEPDKTVFVLFKPVIYAGWAVSRAVVAVLSRTRETVADRTAVEVTGSPAALANALRTIDDRIETTPERDLRETAGISTLSILPLDTDGGVTAGGGGDGTLGDSGLLGRVKRRLFRTHPPTQERLARLEPLVEKQERK